MNPKRWQLRHRSITRVAKPAFLSVLGVCSYPESLVDHARNTQIIPNRTRPGHAKNQDPEFPTVTPLKNGNTPQ